MRLRWWLFSAVFLGLASWFFIYGYNVNFGKPKASVSDESGIVCTVVYLPWPAVWRDGFVYRYRLYSNSATSELEESLRVAPLVGKKKVFIVRNVASARMLLFEKDGEILIDAENNVFRKGSQGEAAAIFGKIKTEFKITETVIQMLEGYIQDKKRKRDNLPQGPPRRVPRKSTPRLQKADASRLLFCGDVCDKINTNEIRFQKNREKVARLRIKLRRGKPAFA